MIRSGSGGSKNRLLARRGFLLRAASAPLFMRAAALGLGAPAAPSDRVARGFIGVGGRGMSHLAGLLGAADTEILAVCDPFESKRTDARKRVIDHYARTRGGGPGYFAYDDFRRVTSRDDIDAVVVASPEHWHGLHMTAAAASTRPPERQSLFGSSARSRGFRRQ